MFKTIKLQAKLVVSIFLFTLCVSVVDAETQVGTVNVTAVVLGEKPIVNSFLPTSGTNTGATVLTKIVGRNFDNVYGVSLDDSNSTVLSGTINLSTGCDSSGENCGGGGSYQSITNLSVPAGVAPGVYNLLVTTPLGTNLLSDSKFTVVAPVATATPSITDLNPAYVTAIAGLNDVVEVSFVIKDSDSPNVNFSGDSNITIVGASVDNYLPVSQVTTDATVADGERVSFDFNANSAGEQYGSLDILVGDGGTPATGNTSSASLDVFIEPSW